MVKKHLNSIVDFKQKRSGYSNYGNPSRLNITRSYKNSMARRMALGLYFDKKIKDIEQKLKGDLADDERIILEAELDKLKKMKLGVSFMEEVDLQYNNFDKVAVPITSAVMFCVMDVSGSMTEFHKDMGKRFFMLLYMFLTKQYERIDIVFIRHHTSPKEVTEEEFFNSKESGGTVVAPAIKMASDIIDKRYSSNWNVYLTQVSDGDVWDKSDADESRTEMVKLLNKIQYAWYIEVSDRTNNSDLMDSYKMIESGNFNYGTIKKVGDVWSLFKDLFSKKL